ncbi:hypothetical protein IJI72_00235 [Candidatus Saccharibacteria bacterium]|nr:hypothetical protein [Candidatus Saccharibacteria bacterium]
MDDFRDAEENAVKTGESSGSEDSYDPREAEESFSSSVVGSRNLASSAKSLKRTAKTVKGAARVFRFAGPLLIVFLLICAFVGILFVSQAAMPFAIVNRLREEFNTNGISSVLRADNILDVQLATPPGSTFSITDVQKAAFRENDIYVSEYNNTTTLTFHNSKNQWTTVVTTGLAGDTGAAEAARAVLGDDAKFTDPAVITISEAMKDVNFKTAYITASKTWRGGNSGWYDELEKLGEEVNGWTRSRWFNYGAQATSATFNQIAASTIKSATASAEGATVYVDASGRAVSPDVDESGALTGTYTDLDGNTLTSSQVTEDTSGTVSGAAVSEAAAIAQNLSTFSTAARGVTNVVCAGVQGLMAVQAYAQAKQRIQKLNLVSGYMEAVQKVQAGDDLTGEPMKEYNEHLLQKDETSKSNAMMSDGMNTLFTGAKVNANDSAVQAVNAETVVARAGDADDEISGDGYSIADLFADTLNDGSRLVRAMKTCNYVEGGLSLVSAVSSGVVIGSIIAGIVTGGIGAIPGIVLAVVKGVAKGLAIAAITTLAPLVAKYVVEKYGKSLISDFATEVFGEELGNMMVSGGDALLSSNHQIGGGSPADEETVAYFKRAQEAVIAEQAEYERRTLSPFDVTSQHTFLGSMVYALVPVATSVNASSALNSLGSILRTSTLNLLPSASAIGETELIKGAAKNDCPTLESVGIQGDPFCNPLYVTDRTTTTVAGYYNAFPSDLNSTVAATGEYSSADTSPMTIIEEEERLKTIEVTRDDSGKITAINYSSDEENELKRYILYCGQRTSNWGSADANIAGSLDSNNLSNRLSAIPVVGDFANFWDKTHGTGSKMDWVTGSACVASSSNPYWNGTSGHNQLHQRFVEDQRLFAEMNVFNKNLIVSFLNEYYEENPLDNSYEGVIARFSGMTKEEVIATEQLIDALVYIANYDPSTRLAFGATDTEEPVVFEEQTENIIALEPKYIIYKKIIQTVSNA